MPFFLLPRLRADSITELTPEYLQSVGIKLLMLDFDNTIVPYTTNQPTEEMAAWLKMMVASEIQLCVVSNSKRDRVKIFCKAFSPEDWGCSMILIYLGKNEFFFRISLSIYSQNS